MGRYVALLRGINVGGRNSVPMARLRAVLAELGFSGVATYIASGNVILESEWTANETARLIEDALPREFALDGERIRVLVLSQEQLQGVVDNRPGGFGSQPDVYHSDVIFLLDIDAADAMKAFDPREGVDAVWPGDGVIYSQRLSEQRTRSRLNRIMGTPAYRSMTIRNWRTTTTLLEMLQARGALPGA
jgi:uncharacterized protein (DUF1697 family)